MTALTPHGRIGLPGPYSALPHVPLLLCVPSHVAAGLDGQLRGSRPSPGLLVSRYSCSSGSCHSAPQRLPRSLTRSSPNPIRSLSAPNHLRTLPPRRSVLLRDLNPDPAGAGLHHLGKARPTSAPPRPNPVPAVASAREHGSELRSQALPPPASRRSE